MYGEICPYENTCYLSSTQTGVLTIQFVLCLRYDMYNKDSAKLYFHVSKHIWVVFHKKPKFCIVGTTICVEDKEHVFPSVEAYMDTFPWKTINRLATTMQFHNILCLVIYFGQGKKLHIYNYGWRSTKVHVSAYLLDYLLSLFYCMYILLVLRCIPASIHVHCILCIPTFKHIE
jgi:hypothetical protein